MVSRNSRCLDNYLRYIDIAKCLEGGSVEKCLPDPVKEFSKSLSRKDLGVHFSQLGITLSSPDRNAMLKSLRPFMKTKVLSVEIKPTSSYQHGEPISQTPLITDFAFINDKYQLELIVVPEGEKNSRVHNQLADSCKDQIHFGFSADSEASYKVACIEACEFATILQTGEISSSGVCAEYTYFRIEGAIVEISHSTPTLTPWLLGLARLIEGAKFWK